MAFAQIIPPGTGAVTTKADFDATNYSQVIIAADALATTETCTLFVKVNGAYVPMPNILNTAGGLTAAVPAVVVPGGVVYGLTKQATAGACGVFGAGIPVR
jgi:hypothetical protein